MEKVKDFANGTDNSEFAELISEYNLKSINSSTPITGRIIDITSDGVIIDIGQKTEGILDRQEIVDWDGKLKYKVGDSIEIICKQIHPKQGYIIVSKKQVDILLGWEKIQRGFEKGNPVSGKIVKFIEEKNGFLVDMGVEMFLPLSQVDIKKIKKPQSFLGKEFNFKVTRINAKEKTGVVSRRMLMEEERKEKIKQLFESLKVGGTVKGVVTNIVDYGAFVDIGELDAFIHKDNISYGRIIHPKEKLRKGDEVEAIVLEINQENQRISLGIKQRFPDPWIDVEKKYPVGKRLIAKVTKIVNFGAFIELEEGIEGLLHISDLTWEGKPHTVEEYVAVGDKLWVQVIEVNSSEKKIKLGLKQLELRPEEKYMQNHRQGDIISGKVKKILKSRVFIELEKNIEGVIEISDISYFRIESPEEFLTENDTIQVMILANELDRNNKVRLGLKQLSDDEWSNFFNKNKGGNLIPVKIKKISEKGISVEITKNIEGFIRPKEIDEKKLTDEELNQRFKVGDQVEAIILSTDVEKKRVYLSFMAVDKKREREEIEKYSKSSHDTITTIGDLLQNEIKKKK